MLKSNKGSVLDIIVGVVLIVAVSIAVLFAHFLIVEFNKNYTGPRDNGFNQTMADGKQAIQIFDYGIVFVLGGLMLATIILAFYIPTHPVLFTFSLIVLIIALLITGIYSNLFVKIATTPQLQGTTNQFPVLYHMIKNLPVIVLGYGIILTIVMYTAGKKGKRRI